MFKKSVVAISVASACLYGSVSFAEDDYKLDTDKKMYSYAIGTKVGQQILQQFTQAGDAVDLDALRKGITTILDGDTPLISNEEGDAAIQKQQEIEMAAVAEETEARKERGAKFRADNKAKSGVVETESGLQYRVIAKGDESGSNPSLNDTVVVHYQGTLIDGTVFDSSYSRGEPATFPLGGIVEGWKEALQLMKVGDKWNVVLPPELAYGERGAGSLIGPNETLVFEIELIEIKKSPN